MEIITLPKNFYKVYRYAERHNLFHKFREKYKDSIREWTYLRRKYKMSFEDLSKQFGFSRATYYRKRKILEGLDEGKAPVRKPQRSRLRKRSAAETALVLKNRSYDRHEKWHFVQAFSGMGAKVENCYCTNLFSSQKFRCKEIFATLNCRAPYKIRSIQVDGRSEFMLEFENACAELNIPLFVNQPATLKNNGGVERGNKTFRKEFYANLDLLAESITASRSALQKAVRKYNDYRPHASLKGLTPSLYIHNHSEAISSHLM